VSSPDRFFKVAFLGNSGVGKSSFIHRFCYNRFLTEISSTVGKFVKWASSWMPSLVCWSYTQ
uniref:Uncharacterized protein n=1 Tax=Salvator merianae TaxID=96440 RepID=A0A8D0DR56_SALMN